LRASDGKGIATGSVSVKALAAGDGDTAVAGLLIAASSITILPTLSGGLDVRRLHLTLPGVDLVLRSYLLIRPLLPASASPNGMYDRFARELTEDLLGRVQTLLDAKTAALLEGLHDEVVIVQQDFRRENRLTKKVVSSALSGLVAKLATLAAEPALAVIAYELSQLALRGYHLIEQLL
jgi:hypothetical protein